MDDILAAKILLKSIDLTSLNDNDTDSKIEKLCEKAKTRYGNVAAVCVCPKFVSLAKSCLENSTIKIATVVNFPKGSSNIERMRQEIDSVLEKGADEIDCVFPYKSFFDQDYGVVDEFLNVIYNSNGKYVSKVILETGEFDRTTKVVEATKLCLEAGANFIKTSTGKTKVSATPEVANIILETISTYPKKAGFKASGGVKTIEDAKKYLILAEAIMGYKWVNSKSFRIGASSLLDNLLGVIECSRKK